MGWDGVDWWGGGFWLEGERGRNRIHGFVGWWVASEGVLGSWGLACVVGMVSHFGGNLAMEKPLIPS